MSTKKFFQPDLVLARAKHYVDIAYKEGALNDNIFGKWYGINHQPWCAMFVSKVFNEAHLSPLVAATTPKGFSACQAGLDWFSKDHRVILTKDAQPGDLVFFQFDTDSAADHIGIVVSNNKITKTLTTYEGNTARDGSGSQANGDGVYKKIRRYSLVKAVARPRWTA